MEKEVSAEEVIDKANKGSDSKLHESLSVLSDLCATVIVEEQVDITDVECEVGIGNIESVCTQDDEGEISDLSVFSVSMVSQEGDNTLFAG